MQNEEKSTVHTCITCQQLCLDFGNEKSIADIAQLQSRIRTRFPKAESGDLPSWLAWSQKNVTNCIVSRVNGCHQWLACVLNSNLRKAYRKKMGPAGPDIVNRQDLNSLRQQYFEFGLEYLINEAKSGCPVAGILALKSKAFLKSMDFPKSQFILIAELSQWTYAGSITFAVLDLQSTVHKNDTKLLRIAPLVKFYAYAEPGDPACTIIRNRPINRTPNTSESFLEIRRWLDHCVANHEVCHEVTVRFVPRRLIRVQHDAHQWIYELIETRPDDDMPYAALSYCWGDAHSVMVGQGDNTIAQNYLDPSQLPQTIRDAMTVAFAIGFEHIWIDSVCIHQQDPADKVLQLRDMPHIYHNADVTIVVNSGKSARQGFLQDRGVHKAGDSSAESQIIRMPIRGHGSGQLGNVMLQRHAPPACAAPLMNRAWALQEWLLSNRIVEYWSTQTRFTCRDRCTHEFDGGISEPPSIGNQISSLYHDFGLMLREGGWKSAAYQYRYGEIRERHTVLTKDHFLWQQIVSAYTERSITQQTDKLPAISAVAQSFQVTLRAEYVAGLWLSHSKIVPELTWRTEQTTLRARPKSQRGCCKKNQHALCKESLCLAPSWSWASLSAPVKFAFCCVPMDEDSREWNTAPKAHHKLQILDCRAELDESDFVYGEVRGGSLRIAAGLEEAIWEPGQQNDRSSQTGVLRLKHDDNWIPAIFYVDALEPEICNAPDAIRHTSVDVYLAVLTAECSYNYYGLVLRKSVGGSFRRIGLYNIHPVYSKTVRGGGKYQDYIDSGGYARETAWVDEAPVREIEVF